MECCYSIEEGNYTEKHYDIGKMIPASKILSPFLKGDKILIEKTWSHSGIGYNCFACPIVPSLKIEVWYRLVENDFGSKKEVFKEEFPMKEAGTIPKEAISKLMFIDDIPFSLWARQT